MPYIKKTTRSGSLLEIEVYYAPNEGKRLARGTNTSQTVEAMVRENERNSQKRQRRLACANFSRKNGDLFVTLTFAQPVEEERVEKEIRNLLDRLRRLRKKKNLKPLRAMVWAECQSCWHLHVLMNGGITFSDLQAVWGERGRKMTMSIADDSQGFGGLIRYVNEEHKSRKGTAGGDNIKKPREKGAHRWHYTKNLIQPVVEKHEVNRRLFSREPNQRKGHILLPDWTDVDTRFGVYQYAAYVRQDDEPDPRIGRKKE